MKHSSKLLMVIASSMLLAACGGNAENFNEKVAKAVVDKTAIAIWADEGSPIQQRLTNSTAGAHAPVLATSFTVKVDGKAYKTSIKWEGIDGVKWNAYKFDEDHVVVIPTRPGKGGESLSATLTPKITYEDATVDGKPYSFVCDPYEVDPIDRTLAQFVDEFYVQKTIKDKTAVRTKGVVTFMSPDYSSVIIQDGMNAVQLYRSSAFSLFYQMGASLSVVGSIKNYSGLEYDPVLDVGPTDKLENPGKFDPTCENIEAFREEAKAGNWSHSLVEVDDELEVAYEPSKKADGSVDTLILKAKDGNSKMALYTKPGIAGSDGIKEISDIFVDLLPGDKIHFRGSLTFYGDKDAQDPTRKDPDNSNKPYVDPEDKGKGLVEANIYSADDLEVTYRVPREESSEQSA